MTPAILTGSHVFGAPRYDSGVDVMCLMSQADAQRLVDLCVDEFEANEVYASQERFVFRFGKLNLIVCTSRPQYDTWRAAHDHCIDLTTFGEAPVSKEVAAELFTTFRKKAGIQ